MILPYSVILLSVFMLNTALETLSCETEPANFTLSCENDGPMQVIDVTLTFPDGPQNCDVFINCSNGYEREDYCRLGGWNFRFPTNEIFCTARVNFIYYTCSYITVPSYENCKFPAPTPTVNVNAIGNETVGSSLSLKCNAIVVKGINSSVDFIWMNDDGEILREINTVEYQENSTRLIYTSYYNISLLETTDDDTMYICEAVINTNSAVNNSDSYTLNVTVPPPLVTITAISNHSYTIGSPLLLICNVITVMGINSSVDIVWMKDDIEDLKGNDKEGIPTGNATLMSYTSEYEIGNLKLTDNSTIYRCEAKINLNASISSSSNYTLNVTVPIPDVTLTALSNLTINSSLLLKCSVTTFEGINSSVDIEWKSNGKLINTTKFKITENAESVFNDSYIDHYLTREDNGTVYQCNAIINTPTPVNATDDYTVVLKPTYNTETLTPTITTTPSIESFNTAIDYTQTALVLAVVVIVLVLSAAILFLGLIIWKNRRIILAPGKKLFNSQDEYVESPVDLDDTDYSIISKDGASTCEYLEKSNQKVVGWIKSSELSNIDEECQSTPSNCTTKSDHDMLNFILGIDEANNETKCVTSDLESNGQNSRLQGFGNALNGSKDSDYISLNYTFNEAHGNPDNEHDKIVQQDATPSFINKDNAHENPVVNIQSNVPVNSTLSNSNEVSYAMNVPDVQNMTVKNQNKNFAKGSQEVTEAPFPVIVTEPSTGHGGYLHYSSPFNKISSPTTAIEGDYVDYIAAEFSASLQVASQSMLHVPPQDSKDENCDNSNHNANAMPQLENTNIEFSSVPDNYHSINFEINSGHYIGSSTEVHEDNIGYLHDNEMPCVETVVTSKLSCNSKLVTTS